MRHRKGNNSIRREPRPLKRWTRIATYYAPLYLLILFMMTPGFAGASEHALWLAGKDEAWKLDEQSAALELVIPEFGKAKALALDDRREVLWVMTRDGYIKSYGYDGSLRLDILPPLESVAQMLHFQSLVAEYEEKIDQLSTDYEQWKHDHQKAFKEWEKQHKLAYKAWQKANPKVSHQEKWERRRQYHEELRAKQEGYKHTKREKKKAFRDELKELMALLREYQEEYRRYHRQATHELHEMEKHGVGLVADKQDGSLWVGSYIGLLKISATGQRLIETSDVGPVSDVAFDIKEKRLWAAGKRKILYLNSTAELIRQIDLTDDERIFSIKFDQKLGELWIVQDDEGLLRYNRDGVLTYSSDQEVKAVGLDGTGNLWVHGKNHLTRITSGGEQLLDIDLRQDWYKIEEMASDVNTHYLWVLGKQAEWKEQYVLKMDWVWIEFPYAWRHPRDWRPPYMRHHHHHGHKPQGMWWPVYWWEKELVRYPGERALARYAIDGAMQLGLLTELKKKRKLAASGDIYKPTVELKEPVDGGLVTPLQIFRMQVSDQGWGVDPAATKILVENAPIDLNCAIDADVLECTPKTPIEALEPTLQVSVQDYADNRSDSIELSVKLDTDNDGHADVEDTYPNDPNRWRLAKVENLQIKLNGTGVALNWDPHADQQNLNHYNIYRTGVDGANPEKINADPIQAVSYIDNSVSNGAGYQYRVIAIDHKAIPGEETELSPYFVAYNYTRVTGLSAVRQGADGLVRWDQADGFRYQVYRGLQNQTPEPLVQVTTETFLDNGAKWYNIYKYQLATIADFVDPFTQQPLAVLGPRSGSALLPALPPLSMSIDDAVADDEGVFELVINTPDRITLTGQYLEAVGPVAISAVTMDGSQQITSESASGRFQLVLPVVADTVWTIAISEITVAERSVELKLRLIEDNTPPELNIDGPLERSTDDDTLLLSGTAIDRHSSVNTITVHSDRLPGVSFGVIQGANGAFSSEIPLERGDNQITVQATDVMGNQANVGLIVTRSVSLAPELVIQSPTQGATVYDPKINLSGVIYSRLDSDSIRVIFGDRQIFPAAGAEEGIHHFTFEDVVLGTGYNNLVVRAETTAGNSEASIIVQYLENPPESEVIPPPEVEITSPSLETTVNESSITVTGLVSGGEDTTLTINGESVDLMGEGTSGGSFKYQLDFSNCDGGITTLTFIATDSAGKTTTKTVNFVCDATPPVIALTTGGLSDAPVVNRVVENPFVLEGTVSDANLAGFNINGQPVTLKPGAVAGTYNFTGALQLPTAQDSTVILEAWDLAANHTSRTLVLNAESPVTIELLSPRQDAELLTDGTGTEIEVITRIGQLEAGYQVTMALDNGTAQPMILDGTMANGVLTTTETTGQHTVTVSVLDSNDVLQASTSVTVSLKDLTQLPLSIERHIPLNAEKNAKPNSFIALYFNRPIETDKLQIEVRQTVHAETYDLAGQKGAGFGDIPKPSIVQVHLDMEPVTGATAYYPTDRYITFHPEERLHYGAYILVDVTYNGAELKRFAFNVEPQPTTLAGVVVDQQRTPLQGITLSLPELGMTTESDSNGNYVFQIRGDVTRTMNDGQYRLVVNPGMKNQQFGITDTWVNLQAQRLNSISAQIVPMLNQGIAFQYISGGNAETVLAAGNLILDLSEAALLFPDGTAQGNAHVQLLQGSQLSFPATASAAPAWMYAVQPAGIAVDGNTGVSILMPRLGGNRDYIPPNGTLVAMLGFNSETKMIEVMGVGEIMDQKVQSLGKLPLQSLDYIGYAMVNEEGQQVLQRYKNGEISSIDILRSELETAGE